MLLEICASSLQSALNAQRAGAHRIELCTELGVGGLTPSYGLLQRVMAELTIPVHVLIRPRSGDFTYSDGALAIMKEDIQLCKKFGCAGVVLGVLKENLTVDIEKTKELVKLAKPLSVTFHRAFDWAVDPSVALETLIELGVDRVLSSGQATSAPLGIELLKKLQTQANQRIEILPGGGINETNIRKFKAAGFPTVHTSATEIYKGNGVGAIPMNTPRMLTEGIRIESNLEKIKSLVRLI